MGDGTKTYYVIVNSPESGREVASLLEVGYTLVASWVAQDSVHHILTSGSNEDE